MYHQSGRFVHYHDGTVLVHDGKVYRFRLNHGGGRRWNGKRDMISCPNPIAGPGDHPVDTDSTFLYEFLYPGSGKGHVPRYQEVIQSHALFFLGDMEEKRA
jgi:hypothetical protein